MVKRGAMSPASCAERVPPCVRPVTVGAIERHQMPQWMTILHAHIVSQGRSAQTSHISAVGDLLSEVRRVTRPAPQADLENTRCEDVQLYTRYVYMERFTLMCLSLGLPELRQLYFWTSETASMASPAAQRTTPMMSLAVPNRGWPLAVTAGEFSTVMGMETSHTWWVGIIIIVWVYARI